jgi:membrane protein|nr:MAG TPA: Stage II sporulation protein M [Inoviridae sp.]
MNRTTYERAGSSLSEFFASNRRLLAFLSLFLLGVFGGAMVFTVSHAGLTAELSLLLKVPAIEGGFQGGISVLFSSCFSTVVLLLLLFLAGLSTCGAPLTVLVPVFFGLGVGLTEAFYYGTGRSGILFVAILVIPHSLLAATALIMGCSESLRMSLLLSGQLLPNAHCGGLWQDFQLYCVRFLVFFGLAFGAGVLDVCLRIACSSWL